MADVTVIIPYHSNKLDLSVLLMQLQSQSILPQSIYLADNSKEQDGLDIVKRYQWSVPIVVDRKPGNIYESWNSGINFAKGDTIIINDDVFITSDFIELMVEFMSTNATDIYCPGTDGFPPVFGMRKHYAWISNDPVGVEIIDSNPYKYVPLMKGWCFGLPYKTVKKVGLFDTQFKCWYGDTDYERRIFEKGGQICMIKGLPVQHFGTSSYSKLKPKTFRGLYKKDQIAFEKKYQLEHEEHE